MSHSSPGAYFADFESSLDADDATERADEDLARLPVVGNRPNKVRCRVLGCRVDVTMQSSSNIRYRICQQHRAAPALNVDGSKQRFCAQCSIFRPLDCYDHMKRTCRECLQNRSHRRKVTKHLERSRHRQSPDKHTLNLSEDGAQVDTSLQSSPSYTEQYLLGALLMGILSEIRTDGAENGAATERNNYYGHGAALATAPVHRPNTLTGAAAQTQLVSILEDALRSMSSQAENHAGAFR